MKRVVPIKECAICPFTDLASRYCRVPDIDSPQGRLGIVSEPSHTMLYRTYQIRLVALYASDPVRCIVAVESDLRNRYFRVDSRGSDLATVVWQEGWARRRLPLYYCRESSASVESGAVLLMSVSEFSLATGSACVTKSNQTARLLAYVGMCASVGAILFIWLCA